MKRKIIRTLSLLLAFILINCTNVFAYAPGDGVYDPGSSDFYNAGRENNDVDSVLSITPEFAEQIAAKEASLLQTDSSKATSYASSCFISNIVQYPQETSYYCGPAAVKSILSGVGNTTVTQSTLAGSSYLKTSVYGNTPWYITNGSSTSDYPAYNTLHAFTTYNYYPYPYGTLGTPPTSTGLSLRIKQTTSYGYGVLACGESQASYSHASHMPGYPTSSNIGHWVAVNGYMDDGNTIWIVDPISGSSAISWSGNVSAYYTVTLTKFTAFVAPRGIFW